MYLKNHKRALRRHHRNRLKRKRKYYWGGTIEENAKSHLLIDTPKACSCFMCGNPRKYFNAATLQELQADLELKTFFYQ